MRELEGLIALGRNMKSSSARRGAQIQVEGDTAYVTNEPKSIALRLKFGRELGDGSFYANEAIGEAYKIQRRDDKVLFVWDTPEGDTRRELIRDAGQIKDRVNEAIDRYAAEGLVLIPPHALDLLDGGILTARVSLKDGKFITRQLRSDASRQTENETDLRSSARGRGLSSSFGAVEEAPKAPDTVETTVFTQDLYVMKGLLEELRIAFGDGNAPLCVAGKFNFGATFEGRISHMLYEV